MKNLNKIILAVFIGFSVQLSAQDVNSSLSDASSSYGSGNLENARFELQEALNGINQTIGKEILDLLPKEVEGMNVVEDSDNVTGTSAGFFAGLYVNREYSDGTNQASFNIMSDSPFLSGINTLLSMSVFMGSDPNQKRIKIDGYKALLTRNESEEGPVSYDIQLPFGNSLMTFSCTGIDKEETVTGMMEDIPVEEIIKMAQ
jgi:hypothetical protein